MVKNSHTLVHETTKIHSGTRTYPYARNILWLLFVVVLGMDFDEEMDKLDS